VLEYREQKGIRFLTPAGLLQKYSILVAFTTRKGGVSRSPYHTLNLAFKVGDEPTDVAENRKRIFQALNLDSSALATAEQIHSNKVVLVTEDRVGQEFPGADALITNLRQVPLALFYADCLPIAIVDPAKRVGGIIHAGWKGSFKEIVPKTISLIKENFSSLNEDLLVFMGPSIGLCCYEIGEEVAVKFKPRFFSSLELIDGRWHLDLKRVNYQQLIDEGILAKNIYWNLTCTACQEDLFFSARKAKGKTGRQAGIVALL